MQANLTASQNLHAADIRGKMFPDDMSGVLEKVRAAREGRAAWEEECDAALRDAYKLGHPVLIAQALTVALNIRIGRLIDQYM